MRLLYICHNHPDLHAGGTEIFALNLFRELKAAHGAEALFVACVDDLHRERRPGTLFQAVGGGGRGGPADEMLMWTGHFDRFYLSQTDTHAIVPEFEALLRDFAPDVVHFHHGLMIGLEAIALVRRVLPVAKIVFTLHDYYPICANDGQMVTTDAGGGQKLCGRASPDSCRRCFPEIEPGRFVLREMHAKHLFGLVDRFVAPSDFLRRRYIDWGLAAERIAVLPNGQVPEAPVPHRALSGGADGRRNRFAFFGHINRFKGASVAVQAAQHLVADGFTEFALDIHGSADFQTEEFRAGFLDAVGKAGPAVRFHGGYRRDEMAALVAGSDWVVVPSVWWENAPLVIQEAFLHKRPVICSGIGGMAEMVRDGVNGLHFRPGDAAALAALMRSASLDPALWERLVAGIPPVRTIADAARDHEQLYASLTGPLPESAASADTAAGGSRRRARKASASGRYAAA